jgi:DNA polymerase-3 subunit gamma/tau
MSYLIFARKYRPKTFEEMVGQSTIVQTLQNAVKTGRIAQAYLFSGMRGVGKTTAARILAKTLNCVKGPTPVPCNECEFCKAIDEDRLVDVLEIDGASNRGIEDIRELREAVKYKAMHSRWKVITIDEVHQITKDGFNALLKTLEEPPPSTVFIFATTEFSKVPATIVSRCQHFEFKKVSHKDLVEHLRDLADKEHLTISPFGLSLIADASEGSIRDAQSLLDQAVAFCGETIGDEELKEILGTVDRDLLFEFSSAVIGERPDLAFSLTAKLVDSGTDLRGFTKELIQHFRNLLVLKTVERAEDFLVFGADEIARYEAEAGKASTEDLLRYLHALQAAEGPLRFSSHPQIFFETTIVKLCHFRKIVELRDLIPDSNQEKKAGGEGVRPVELWPQTANSVPVSPPSQAPAPPRAAPRPAFNIGKPKPAEPVPPSPSAAGPDPASARRTEHPPKKERGVDKALAEPNVREFVDRFKARVVSCESVKDKPEAEKE